MQFVKTADLKPGMRLAKPIYNKMGVLLYERDTLLTMQGINSIENFGLIGIFILEPAEPVPPLSREDLEFEQFQTIYVFKLKENMDRLQANQAPVSLSDLVRDIQTHYGSLDHKLNFAQNLRSSADFCLQTFHQCRHSLCDDHKSDASACCRTDSPYHSCASLRFWLSVCTTDSVRQRG